MENDYNRTGDTSHQGWSKDVKAWDQANIVAPASASKATTAGGLYVSASAWQDAPTGPPVSLFDIQVAREQQMADDGHDRYISRQSSQSGAKYDDKGNITGVASYSKANEPHKLIEGAVGHVAQAIQDSLRQAVAGAGAPPLWVKICLLYTSPSPRDVEESRMPSSA